MSARPVPELKTERLTLRAWRPEDREPFARLNADPAVMEHFPARLGRAESDALAERLDRELRESGYGRWVVEAPGAAFAGFVGLSVVPFEAPFTPAIEIGWRLGAEHWGRGYATEAARAALRFGFEALRLDEVVSFTTLANRRSWRVMEKLGMRRDPLGDFEHPRLPRGHALRPHVLYRLRREDPRG